MKHTTQLLAVLLILVGISSCRPIGHPPIEELLIDLSAFPEGWSVSADGPSPIARAPLGGTKSVDSTELFFYVTGGGAYERIRRFNDSQGTADEYARQMKHIFRETEFNTPWVVPEEIMFKSSSAEQFYYACSQFEGSPWPRCVYIAQYGVYFTHFKTGMFSGYMSYFGFENILQIIDEHMAPFGKNEDK
jgi:hypothetical protein